MSVNDKTIWSVYHTDDISLAEEGVIAVRDHALGDLSGLGSKSALRERFEAAHPGEMGLDKTVAVSLLDRFAREMRVGDLIVYRSYRDAVVRLGVITSAYVCDETSEFPHRRSVEWRKSLPQNSFSSAALREIGYSSPAPLFPVKCHTREFFRALGIAPSAAPAESAEPAAPAAKQSASTEVQDYVLSELSRRDAYHGFKEFAAGLLQAMGYRVTLLASARRDIDIIAHRDELMPRMLVKIADGPATLADVEDLRGAQKRGDYGLLLSLSDFPSEVEAELSASADLRGVAGAELAALTLKYYGAMQERYRRLIPLKAVYVPVA